jgi:outer membrane protein assembly factor BamE (lipoprotein component of BamABCDE complex)
MSATRTTFAAKLLALMVVTSWSSLAQVEKHPEEVKIGQTVAEVHALLGMPDLTVTLMSDHVTERWTISPSNIIHVRFDDGKVGWIDRPPNPHPPEQPSQQNSEQTQIRDLQRQIDELRKQLALGTPQVAPLAPTTFSKFVAVPIQVTPTPMSEPKTLVIAGLPSPAAVQSVQLGQTLAEVHALLGTPTAHSEQLAASHPEQWAASHTETWDISRHDALSVRFDGGKVAWTKHFDPNPWQHDTTTNVTGSGETGSPSKGPSRWSRFGAAMEKVGNVALGVGVQYTLSQVCPDVYRKPMIFMTANDLQWLQACNANGYMLFGLYVYTGPR